MFNLFNLKILMLCLYRCNTFYSLAHFATKLEQQLVVSIGNVVTPITCAAVLNGVPSFHFLETLGKFHT